MRYLNIILVLVAFVLFASCDLQDKSEEETMTDKILLLMEESNLDENVLLMNGITDGQIHYAIENGWVKGWSETSSEPGDEVCRGGGIRFARCVQRELDEGKCLLLYKEDGDYVAEEAACEEGEG